MSWTVSADAARDTALAVATVIPVVAVAYYTVRGSEPGASTFHAEWALPAWVRAERPPGKTDRHPQVRRGLRGCISLFGRVPVANDKIILTEAILFAADAAFVRSFTPGLVAALLAVLTGGDLRWTAVGILLLYAMASQLVASVTLGALLRRDEQARSNEAEGMTPSVSLPEDAVPAEGAPPPQGRWTTRARRFVVDFWLRRLATRRRSTVAYDMRPFDVLAFIVVLQALLGIVVFVMCAALFFCGRIDATPKERHAEVRRSALMTTMTSVEADGLSHATAHATGTLSPGGEVPGSSQRPLVGR